jgi:hypothetical protein
MFAAVTTMFSPADLGGLRGGSGDARERLSPIGTRRNDGSAVVSGYLRIGAVDRGFVETCFADARINRNHGRDQSVRAARYKPRIPSRPWHDQ